MLSFRSRYLASVRIEFRYVDTPPTFSEMDILLSFKITIKLVSRCAALFSASYAIPPVREPSPITDTTVCLSPKRSLACARPSPAEIEVELCPVSKLSQSLSFRFGKPLIPPNLRSISKPSLLPVSILCVYD